MTKTAIPEDIKAGFEDALSELEEIVRSLESSGTKLDGAIAAYERGALLKQHCETSLPTRGAGRGRRRPTVGAVKAEPADIS